MNIEVMIYIYMAVCTAMIVFNCVVVIVNGRQEQSIEKLDSKINSQIMIQLHRLEMGEAVEEEHLLWLEKKLRRMENLHAFDLHMERIMKTHPRDAKLYLDCVCKVFVSLSDHYCRRDTLKAAYFAYLVRKYRIAERSGSVMLLEHLMGLLISPNVYARENALHSIYALGDAHRVVCALRILDRHNIFHHSKLIHDGLLEFGGSRTELLTALWQEFERFSSEMQTTLVNYMRLSGGGCDEQVFALMVEPKLDDEVYFACMRYFGRFAYAPAYPVLLDDLREDQGKRWELAAVAATALRNYPGEKTVELLKTALYSSVWYVRSNAAESLEALGVSYVDLAAVFEGEDRYAREILQYRMDYRKAGEEIPV